MATQTDIHISEGHAFKTLIELLNSNFTRASINIMRCAVYISEINDDNTIMIEAKMTGENFTKYVIPDDLESDDQISAGVTLNHLKSLLNPIKKKDGLQMSISAENTDMLGFAIISAGKKSSKNIVKIINTKENETYPPDGYKDIPSSHIQSSDFGDLCKQLKQLRVTNTTIIAQERGIKIIGKKEGLYGTEKEYGEWEDDGKIIYEETFPTKIILKIAKMAALSKTIKLFCLPKQDTIKLRTNIGSLGNLDIYITPPKIAI